MTPTMPRDAAATTNGSQYPDGMLSRCHHFRTAEIEVLRAARSEATASNDGQSARSVRGESDMHGLIGQLVLKDKAKVSHDCGQASRDILFMSKDAAASDFKKSFMARTKQARETANLTQEQVAKALGIEQGKYKQYETRSPLPHFYIERFCIICAVNTDWLFSARGKSPRVIKAKDRTAA